MSELAAVPFRTVDLSNAIANDSVIPYYLDDRNLRVAIARIDDHLYVFDDLCTCGEERCPLSGGLLEGTTIMCQCHGSWFDITTGGVISGPATDALAVYDVDEVEGAIQIRVTQRAREDGRCDRYERSVDMTNLLPERGQMAFTLAFQIILVPFGVAFTFLMLVANYRAIRHDDPEARKLAERWWRSSSGRYDPAAQPRALGGTAF